jgi:hypothetical protein
MRLENRSLGWPGDGELSLAVCWERLRVVMKMVISAVTLADWWFGTMVIDG